MVLIYFPGFSATTPCVPAELRFSLFGLKGFPHSRPCSCWHSSAPMLPHQLPEELLISHNSHLKFRLYYKTSLDSPQSFSPLNYHKVQPSPVTHFTFFFFFLTRLEASGRWEYLLLISKFLPGSSPGSWTKEFFCKYCWQNPLEDKLSKSQ